MPRPNKKVEQDGCGYEIKGFSSPMFKRRDLVAQADIDLDIPNGDLQFGQKMYRAACAGCHDMDHDYSMGPALRTVYLRKAGSRKNFQLWSNGMKSMPIYWTKKKLWEFLENPEKMYPDTNMSFDGIQNPKTMASIIEYLHFLRVGTSALDNQSQKRVIM